MTIEELKPILEAALLASSHALTVPQLQELFDEAERPGHEAIARTLEALSDDCAARGVELKEVASGFRYQIKPEVYGRINRLWAERAQKYSRATLETLALIAYRQPITRGEIEAIRGVSVSSNIIKSLEEREWIRVVGHRELPGRPALFGTTRQFLDYFGLKALEELPTLAELKDFNAAPELDFGGGNSAARAAAPSAALEKPADELEVPAVHIQLPAHLALQAHESITDASDAADAEVSTEPDRDTPHE
jgi:segregation and condensation protein B